MFYEVLKIVHFMTEHGFYTEQSEINSMASSVIAVLDGSNDRYK